METSPEIPILRAQQITMKIHGLLKYAKRLKVKMERNYRVWAWREITQLRITIHKI